MWRAVILLCAAMFFGCSERTARERQKLEKDAAEGSVRAKLSLAEIYASGRGVPKDDAKAAGWYLKAADDGSAEAQFQAGNRHAGGLGLPKDDVKAFERYRQAAEQGHPGAQAALGSMYRKGSGVEKDEKKAIGWYRKSAAQGNEEARRQLEPLDSARGVAKDTANASGQGEAKVQAALASEKPASEAGTVAKEPEQGSAKPQAPVASKLELARLAALERVAADGDPDSQLLLGNIYAEGKNVPKDNTKAAGWFEKAAALGNEIAQYNIGVMYANGEGVPKDEARACAWFSLVAAVNADAAQKRDALEKGMTAAQKAEVQKLVTGLLKKTP